MAKTVSLTALLAGGKTPAQLIAERSDTPAEMNVTLLTEIAKWDQETNRRVATEMEERGYSSATSDKRAGRYLNVSRVKSMQAHATLSTTVVNLQKDITGILFVVAKANEETSIPLHLSDVEPDADGVFDALQALVPFTVDLKARKVFLTHAAAAAMDENVLVGIQVLIDDQFSPAAKDRKKALAEFCSVNPIGPKETKESYVKRIRAHFDVETEETAEEATA